METLFGIPANTLLSALLIALAIIFAVVAYSAVRYPLPFRLGIRNLTRRKSQTLLIVSGLALSCDHHQRPWYWRYHQLFGRVQACLKRWVASTWKLAPCVRKQRLLSALITVALMIQVIRAEWFSQSIADDIAATVGGVTLNLCSGYHSDAACLQIHRFPSLPPKYAGKAMWSGMVWLCLAVWQHLQMTKF